MFRSALRKTVGLGLALCIVGTMVLSGPATTREAWDTVSPFLINCPVVVGDED